MKFKYFPRMLLGMITILILGLLSSQALAQDVQVIVNGQTVQFDQKPFINKDNRIMVPVRAPMEAAGASVSWNDATRQTTITKDGKTAIFTIGSKQYIVNGNTQQMDTTAQIAGDRTVFPIRFVAEAIWLTVGWDAQTQTVTIMAPTTPEGTQAQGEILVFIRQPVPEKRLIINEDYTNGVEVGTTWLVIKKGPNAEPFVAHFTSADPILSISNGQILVNFDNVPGKVWTGKEAIDQVNDKPWHASLRLSVTEQQALQAIAFCKGYQKPFNVISNNCTNFTVDVLKSAGVTDVDSLFIKHELALPDVYQQFFKAQKIDLTKAFNGYAPGDVVEDWRHLQGIDNRISIR